MSPVRPQWSEEPPTWTTRTYFKLKEEFVLGPPRVVSQAYPYLLVLLQVIHVLRLKVDGDDQRCQEPRVCKISSGVAQPFRFSS
jgi:hypothetical protein